MSIDIITLTASKNYTDKQIEKASIGGVDLSGYVQSINGIIPDENGNVEITTPDCGGNVDEEQIAAAVNKWLDEHPEATTTVKWGNISAGEIFELATDEEPSVPVLIPCTGITLDKTELAFSDTETTVVLQATVTPFDTTDQIVWSVDKSGVVTVENGVVKATANGSCVITAKCGAYSATCSVTVNIVVSYTKENLDGYFDFIGVEDGYSGIVTNKAANGTLQGEIFSRTNTDASNKNHYGGVKNGEMLTGETGSLGGYGSYDGFAISQPDTGKIYTSYPYTLECYGAMRDGWVTAERNDDCSTFGAHKNGSMVYSTRVKIDTFETSHPDFGGIGTSVWFEDTSTIKSFGGLAQGNNTFTLDYAVDVADYHHYVVCVDKALIRVYLDGVMVGEGTATNNSSASSGPLIALICGNLKMVRVYNAILTDEQVANNYTNTIGVYGGDA